jgi:hypothetical protein
MHLLDSGTVIAAVKHCYFEKLFLFGVLFLNYNIVRFMEKKYEFAPS